MTIAHRDLEMTPLVSTSEVRLDALSSTKMSRDRQTFRLPTRETPSSRHQAHRFPLMQAHLRLIQYP